MTSQPAINLSIRPLKSIEDGRAIEQIIMAAWGSDPDDAVPFHLTFTIEKENAGVVLLAFDGQRPVGFCLGFWAKDPDSGRWKCASHMAAVIPAYAGRGIGEQLKWAQRDAVMARGFDLMSWTFDPLETMNGRLNLHKLGAVCREYHPNLYGDVADALNKGNPTDRFRVDWWLGSGWVESRRAGKGARKSPPGDSATLLNPLRSSPSGHPQVAGLRLERLDPPAGREVWATVPRNFQQLKTDDPVLALDWRLQTRTLFQAAFAHGFTAVDLVNDAAGRLCYYLLQPNWSPEVKG